MTDVARPSTGAEGLASRLLVRSAAGDTEAFAELYDVMASRVHGLVVRIVRDPHLSEETTQDVFLEIWRKAASYDPGRGPAVGWILAITHRRAVDRVRSTMSLQRNDSTWQPPAEEDRTADTTFELASARLRARQVTNALASLPVVQRQALELAYLGGLTYAEVSQLTDTPLGTTKTRIRTALIALRSEFAGSGLAPVGDPA